ncbi:MAG TPA: Ser-Thr-rich GPI-anchored membrane family protein [Candidatus Bathyarchaeia archaeon]|nr:Ser-Thr-rich GPI-anchored membrane family protein [Candidatus Bathyarchaeia archaeon]
MTRKEKAMGIAVALYVAIALTAAAAPQLSFRPVSVMPGDTAFLELDVTGADDHYLGVNVKFSLPNGVTVSSVAMGDLLTDNFTLDSHRLDNSNTYTALAYSVTDSVPPDEGSLLRFGIEVSNDLAELGLDTVEVIEAAVPILKSGIAAFDGDTALDHTAANGMITLSRDPLPALAVVPPSRTVTSFDGTTSFSVSNAGSASLSWVASVNAADTWLTITSSTSGTDAGVIEVSFERNPAASSRSGSIVVDAGDVPGSPGVVTVTQVGNTNPWLDVLPAEQTVNADATSAEFTVANTGFSTLTWAASLVEGDDWASISAGVVGVNAGVIRLSFSTNNAAADRTAVVRVVGENAYGSPAQVTLTQRGREPLEVITPNGAEVWHRGITETITWCSESPKAVTSVSILLLKGGNVLRTIAETTHNIGAYEWTIPLDMEPSHNYKIQILDVNYPAVHDESDAPFGINCPPDSPTNVVASEGEPRRVEVTWEAVDTATSYEVYRSTSESFADAQLIGTTSATVYEDTQAAQPQGAAGFSCAQTKTPVYYWYWVKSVNGCDRSGEGYPDQGFRAKDKSEVNLVWARVLPGEPATADTLAAHWNSTLAMRLSHESGIEPESVMGWVEWDGNKVVTTAWLPINDTDGWIVYAPTSSWPVGAEVTFTAWAQTPGGEAVGTVVYSFTIVSDDVMPAGKEEEYIWQPDYSDFESPDLDLDAQTNAGVGVHVEEYDLAPELANGVGRAYVIGPAVPFETPRRVWLPLPEGLSAGAAVLYYYHQDAEEAGWYPADQVRNWVEPDSYLALETRGIRYVGFLVRHGGVVRLGDGTARAETAAASVVPPVRGITGDLLILGVALAAIALGGVSRRTRNSTK